MTDPPPPSTSSMISASHRLYRAVTGNPETVNESQQQLGAPSRPECRCCLHGPPPDTQRDGDGWRMLIQSADVFNSINLSLSAAALHSPVYRYVVTHTPSGPVNVTSGLLPFPSRFSFHCLDVVAFFGGLESVLGTPLSDKDRNFQELIRRHLVNFARTGKMKAEWPEYPAATALLSGNLTVKQDYRADRCRLWRENGLYAYAWIN
ncbi:uncharacterized protein LOC118320843 [Morone saxatilis]|uniref:uncharacterized protein LOC118320843 n=1 Tax=Morone saxatilis TaxID=34816 RepID=UPI0015E1C40C|nr:uncharacterized protein LOC118320843 [Morone saxatilis]